MSEEMAMVCIKCEVEKPLSGFSREKTRAGNHTYRTVCRACRNLARRKTTGPVKVVYIDEFNKLKECTGCDRLLSFDKFGSDKSGRCGLQCKCRECNATNARRRRNGGTDPGPKCTYFVNNVERLRECTICGGIFSFDEFGKDVSRPDGIKEVCKLCLALRYSPEIIAYKPVRKVKSDRYINADEGQAQCTLCWGVKPFKEFAKRKGSQYGISSQCLSCQSSVVRKNKNGGIDPGRCNCQVNWEDQTKECTSCWVFKPFSEFYATKLTVTGRTSACKVCTNKLASEQRYKNPQLRLRDCVRDGVVRKLKAKTQDEGERQKFREIYAFGCSLDILVFFIENQFYPHPSSGKMMTWENYGKPADGSEGWDVDHIKPLASFDLLDEGQFKQASHVSNLQPLWHLDNSAKKDKLMTQDESRAAYNREMETH